MRDRCRFIHDYQTAHSSRKARIHTLASAGPRLCAVLALSFRKAEYAKSAWQRSERSAHPGKPYSVSVLGYDYRQKRKYRIVSSELKPKKVEFMVAEIEPITQHDDIVKLP